MFNILSYPRMACALTLWVGALGSQAASAKALHADRPNYLIFIADDHGMGDLGCYGNPAVRTPNIDRLATEGMRFDRAFLTISSCSPSRCSILTGRYPHNTGAEDLHMPLPADQRSVASYLKPVGYECVSVGKWHLGNDEKRHWNKVVECQADVMADRCLEVIAERDQDKPFFYWFASIDPHRGYQEGTIQKQHDPDKVVVPPYLPDHPKIRKEIALYYDEISRFDEHIGRIREALEKQGVWDNTLVIYMSDNGMPFPRAKTTLYDSGIRTPFIARWPGKVPTHSHSNALISTVDLAPTVLELAGIKQKTTQGRSFINTLKNPKANHRDMIFAEANWHDFEHFTRTVRSDRFKLIRHYYWDTPLWNSVDSINSITWQGMLEARDKKVLTRSQAFLFEPIRPYEEFFVMDADPDELTNQIDVKEWQSEINRLRTALDEWRIETQDQLPAKRRLDGWTRDGLPLPHNQPWYDRYIQQGRKNSFEKF
ncbi:MAG: sulfatase [Verrucomicrobia bacterium]|jgi:N-sulfoglucosamine sulfohydrolase|nr:sulfatase [Verrucomicrobiota bacterium]